MADLSPGFSEEKILNLDITNYWLIIQKRFIDILLVFILVMLVTIIMTKRQKPVYQAMSKVRIAARQPMATIEGAQITWYGGGGATASIQSEIELISNKDSISQAVEDILKNRATSKFLKENSGYFTESEFDYIKDLRFSPEDEAVISGLNAPTIRARLDIEPLFSSDIIAIKFNGETKGVSEALANIYAMVYKADFWKSKTNDAKANVNFIEQQLKDIKDNLEKHKNILEKSSEENVSLGMAEVYQEELSKLKIELTMASETYQASHPKIQKLKKMIVAIEEELAKFPHVKHEYDDRIAERESMQELFLTFEKHYVTAGIDYNAKREKTKDEIQIISMALPGSAVKISPKETINISIGALLGIIIALVYAFTWEGLDTSIGKIEDVERFSKLSVIGHVPVIGGDNKRPTYFFRPLKLLGKYIFGIFGSVSEGRPIDIYKKTLLNFQQFSQEQEAYRTLRTNIQFAIGTNKPSGNVISITSSTPTEGKTLTSINLAIVTAQLGKMTLLLEADMRKPKIANTFKLHKREGLSDVLLGTTKVENAICTSADLLMGGIDWNKLTSLDGLDHLHVLLAGTLPPNPTELLLSEEFRQLIEKLRPNYDFIIVDTPPVLPVADAGIIGTVTDGCILVYQSDKTSRHLFLRAIQMLQKNRIKILGVVINQLAFDIIIKSSRYGYNYYYSSSPENKKQL